MYTCWNLYKHLLPISTLFKTRPNCMFNKRVRYYTEINIAGCPFDCHLCVFSEVNDDTCSRTAALIHYNTNVHYRSFTNVS